MNKPLSIPLSSTQLRAGAEAFCRLSQATILACLLTYPNLAAANPVDGTIAAGTATITSAGKVLDVNQSSQRVVIDWRGFDIAGDEVTNFNQPNSGAIALNRVNSADPSKIFGKLNANGKVVLINPNGVLFGAGSVVDVNGLVATTADVDNAKFMAGGDVEFSKASANTNAAIINNGMITARNAGLVGLVAPNVENNGVINANLGVVHLAGGDTATVDFYGDRLMEVAVSDDVTKQVVTNTGTINAAGGQIAMTAAAGSQIIDSLITVKGELKAPAVAMQNGSIYIFAEGSNAVKGNVEADKGIKPGRSRVTVDHATLDVTGTTGGKVAILADQVGVINHSTIDASGTNGGGTIHVGGEYQGYGPTPTSLYSYIEAGSQMKANALDVGNGGNIITWSDGDTHFYGTSEIRGGANGGNGGLAEVSGLSHLIFDGMVDASAAHGSLGQLLLDPTNIEITSAAAQNVTYASNTYTPNADDVTSYVNATTLMTNLSSASIIVQTRATGSQAGDLTVSTALSNASINTLTLIAHRDIVINNTINVRNLTLQADRNITIGAALTSNNNAGTLEIKAKTAGTSMGVAGGAGTVQLTSTSLNNIGNWGTGASTINLGATTGVTGDLTVGAYNWSTKANTVSFYTSGAINITGAQTFRTSGIANIWSDREVTLGGALTATTATLNVRGYNLATNMDFDSAANGTGFTMTAGSVANLGTWTTMNLGAVGMTGNMSINAGNTWSSTTTNFNNTGATALFTASGVQAHGAGTMNINNGGGITFNSGADFTGAGAFNVATNRELTIGSALTGTGALSLKSYTTSTNIDLDTAANGTGFTATTASLNNIGTGWTGITIGGATTTGNVSLLTGRTWNSALTLQTSGAGAISISGAQAMGTRNFTSTATTGAITLNSGASIAGTGTVTMSNTTGGINLVAGSTINTNAAAIFATDRDFNVGSALTLSSTVGVRVGTSGTTMNLDSAANGTGFTMSAASITNLGTGGTLQFGTSSLNSSIGIASGNTWLRNTVFSNQSGSLTINGVQAMGTNSWTSNIQGTQTWNAGADITGSGAVNFGVVTLATNNAFTGTGALTVNAYATNSTLNLGNAGGNATATTMGYLAGGAWSGVTLGGASQSAAVNLNSGFTWNSPVTMSAGSGAINVSGVQAMGNRAFSASTTGLLTLASGANITGSGTTTLTSLGTGITLANGADIASSGALNLTSNGTVSVGSLLTGTGALTMTTAWGLNMSFGSTTGSFKMDAASIANLGTRSGITINQSGYNATTYFDSASTWNAPLTITFGNNAGHQIFNAVQTVNGAVSIFSGDGNVTFNTGSGITSNYSTADVNGNINALWINTRGTFTNSVGTGVFNLTGGGRWLIHTFGIASNVRGGLVPDGSIFNASIYGGTTPTSITSTGNRFIYHNTQATAAGALTLGFNNFSRAYGSSSTPSSVTVTGFKGTDTQVNATNGAANVTTSGGITTATGVGTTVDAVRGDWGTMDDVGSLAYKLGYTFNTSFAAANWGDYTITQAALTVAGNNKTQSYGDGNSFNGYTITGLQNSETVGSVTLTGNATSSASGNWNAGTWSITPSAATGGTFNAANYSITYTAGTLQINPASLTVTANDKTQGYGAGNTYNGYTVGSLATGDTYGSVTLSTNATSSATGNWNAGTWAITPSALTGGNFAASNYNITYTPGVLQINQGALTITATNKTQTYGGGNTYNGFSTSGLGVGETVGSVTYATNATNSASANWNAGTWAITPSAATGGNFLAANYNITYVDGTLQINPASLTVNADNKNKTYGAADPALTYTVASGLVAGEASSTFSGALSRAAGSNAGTYAISQGTLASSNANYTIGTFNAGTFTIDPALLTITATNKNKTYGAADPALTYTTNGDGTEILTGALTRAAGNNAGTYAITQGTLAVTPGNYIFGSFNAGVLTIDPALLTITATNKNKTYGAADPALTYTTNGDGTEILTGALARAAGNNAGTYAINQGTLAVTAGNYIFGSFNAGVFTIDPALLTITATNKNKTYGAADPALTYTTNGDGTEILTGALTRAAGNNAGTYAITQGTLAVTPGNYIFSAFNAGTFTIDPALLTVTAANKSKTYGAADPSLTYTTNGDGTEIITGALTRAAGSNAGTYAITQGTLGVSGNYTLGTFNAGTFTIDPALLTVTADNKSKTYGAADPALSYTLVSGLTNGDTSTTFSGAITRAAGSNAGTYAITQGTLASSNSNYIIGTFNAGVFTIDPALLTVTADNKNKTYGAADPSLSYQVVSGLTNGDTSTTFSGAITRAAGNNAGTYAISQGTLASSNGNYLIGTFNNGTFTIDPALLTVTADNKNKTYGAADPSLTYSITSGLVGGDTTASFTGALTRAAGSNAGTYAINQGTLAATGNYSIGTFATGTFTIDPTLLIVTAINRTRTYGDTDPVLTYTYTGLVNGDGSTTFSGALARAAGNNAGVYAINQGTLASSNANYNIGTFNAGAFTINPALLTVNADAKSINQGDVDPAFTYNYTGLVGGDTTTSFSGGLNRAAGTTAGTYSINQGTLASSNGNYTIGTYNNALLTINAVGGGGGGGGGGASAPVISASSLPTTVSFISQNAAPNLFRAPAASSYDPAPSIFGLFDWATSSTSNEIIPFAYNFNISLPDDDDDEDVLNLSHDIDL